MSIYIYIYIYLCTYITINDMRISNRCCCAFLKPLLSSQLSYGTRFEQRSDSPLKNGYRQARRYTHTYTLQVRQSMQGIMTADKQ